MAEEFDVIVLGAGSAGVCAAAELTLQGARTLLVAESKEVGYHFRTARVGDCDVPVQFPTRNIYSEAGYWWNLVRKLNVPVQYRVSALAWCLTFEGSGVITEIPECASAAALAELLAEMSPVPLGSSRGCLERVLFAGMSIPPAQLSSMRQVRLVDWLAEQGADEVTAAIFVALGCNLTYLDAAMAAEHLSVFGLFAPVRSFFCSEAQTCSIRPDPRNGLFIPLAQAIEQRGNSVWRGSRVAEIVVRHGVATGVALGDGREATAPVVASTFGSSRLSDVLDPLPDEVRQVSKYEEELGGLSEYTFYALTEHAKDPAPYRWIVTLGEDGSFVQADWNTAALAPWCVPEGMQLIGSEVVLSEAAVEAIGGPAVLHEEMKRRAGAIYSGYSESIVATASLQHKEHMTAWCIGPKLPQRSTAVRGLWHVGEGSSVVDGCYVDGAASAGVLGARAIAEASKTQ